MTSPANQNKLTQLAASKLGARLWRMSVGFGWIGNHKKFDKTETIVVNKGDVLIRQARPFNCGVEGMSDNGGFIPITVTPEMVGQKVAVTLWVEDKSGAGRATLEQKNWIRMVRSFGGRAGVARSDDDVRRICSGELLD